MINKATSQILNERLPLALVSLPQEVVDMLEWKWGREDDIFHSVKATTKTFKKFKDVDIRNFEDEAMRIIDSVLSGIYACPNCHIDLRKCGVVRRVRGIEIVELYISEDGKQARTTHERFEPDGGLLDYNCMGCQNRIDNRNANTYDFLKRGIHRNVCIDYLHRNHPNIAKKTKEKMSKQQDFYERVGDVEFARGPDGRPIAINNVFNEAEGQIRWRANPNFPEMERMILEEEFRNQEVRGQNAANARQNINNNPVRVGVPIEPGNDIG